jgi:hypothetical protein
MKINRVWAMPSSETFTIRPIKELVDRYIRSQGGVWIDPFVRNSIFKSFCALTNDLNPTIEATYNLEALEFLKKVPDAYADGVLFDPPYSFRQIMECYNGVGREVFQTDTNASFYSYKKNEIARIVKSGGLVLSFGWNSMGVGKKRGFEMIEILMVPHGGHKNDTIVTVERKL